VKKEKGKRKKEKGKRKSEKGNWKKGPVHRTHRRRFSR
jgi:hypothetical protein